MKSRHAAIEAGDELAPWELCHPSTEPSDFHLDPAWIESALRRALELAADGAGSDGIWQPERIARVELAAGGFDEGPVGHRVGVSELEPDRLRVDLALSGAAERAVAKLEGVDLVRHEPCDIVRSAMGPFRDWLYTLQWHERSVPPATTPGDPGLWLVLLDESGVGAALCASIEAAGGNCVCVTPARDFFEISPNRFGVQSANEAHLATILRRYDFDHAVHLWSLNGRSADRDTGADEVLRSQSLGPQSLQGLVRACLSVEASPRVWIATCGAEHVLPDDRSPGVAQAPVWGFGRALAVAHPELWGGLIDLDPAADPQTRGQSLHDVLARADEEDHLAVRGAKRFVARIEQKPHHRPVEMPPLNEDATYLIAGGFGAWGISLAGWLAERGARHLVLLGHVDTSWSDAADVLAELEARGVEARIATADISDEAELGHVLEAIARDLPPLRGVFHVAATLEDWPLDQQDAESFERTFRRGALGAWNLHRLTRDLDLFVMFSSISGTFGFKGMESQAATHHFVDALARHRAAAGLPALSASWGPAREQDSASHAGSGRLRNLEASGLNTISLEEALETLEALIGYGDAHTLVAPFDVTAYLEHTRGGDTPTLFRDLATARRQTNIEPPRKIRAQLRSMDLPERTRWIENRVRALAAQVLGTLDVEQIDPERPLLELGLDSLSAMEMRDVFEREVGVRIPVRVLFEDPSPRQIARRIVGLLGAEPPVAQPALSPRSAL